MSKKEKSKIKPVILVDALNLFTRHFVAHPATGSNGQHVGGIVGFLYAIANMSEKFSPESVIVLWEGGGSSKKRSVYSHRAMANRRRHKPNDIL